ncbi:DUF4153 domain-containing protein [Clostridium formicaceticum]|uniref:DUF4173 domain-containing protein n=1 Tax=Clostridium formicaceticum TaxID=1497 RepID=A0AAC9RI56_9CLOT|nr:DUF4173 domain-containing protein [Clostridium formicaceticum]AOY76118.1 hypothetical protein BJL90_09525 [Clostridium formicaceticum]ARE86486.1 hypothetical protein CLFO_08080 [Clostridium formicaceticum]
MAKKVQGIIVKNDKILTVEGMNQAGRIEHFFIWGEVKDGESEAEAMQRVLEEQLDLKQEITFQFEEEIDKRVKTFFVDLQGEEVDIENSLEKVDCFRNYFKAMSLKWIQLNDIWSFRELETNYIKLLLKEAIKKEYQAPWIEVIKQTYFNHPREKAYLKKLHVENKRNKVDAEESIRNKGMIMLMALGLGVLFDYFFVGVPIGISGFIFNMIILIASVYGMHHRVQLNKKLGFIFLVPTILLSLSFSIYNNYVLKSINVIFIPFLIASYLITIRYENIKKIDIYFVGSVLKRVFVKAYSILPRFFTFSKEIKRDRKKLKENPTQKNIITGLLISIPLLVIILLLLTSADMMFKYYVDNIGSLFRKLNTMRILGHTFVIIASTLYLFGFLWSFKYDEIAYEGKNADLIKTSWEPVTIITIIFVINIAYLLFTIIQFSYLYGGGLHALPEGFSYAEYARKGFFELVLVTLINFSILLLSINLTKKSHKKVNTIANLSYSLLILFTVNMVVSANYKMYLYERAFGFTRLRIFVQAFMLLIGTLLIILLLGIWINKIPIFQYAVIATLVVYIGLNFINVDGLIAKGNILRYQETGIIDMNYMKQLSYDAIPQMTRLLEAKDPNIRNAMKEHIQYQKEILDKEDDRWYGLNYYKSKLLNSHF